MTRFKNFYLLFVSLFVVMGFSSCRKDDDLDMESPSIFILSPTSEKTYVTNEASITISGTADDNIQLKKIIYSSNAGVSGSADGLEQWSINDLPLADGDNIVTITAIDKSGNENAASITITKNKYLLFFGTPSISNLSFYANVATDSWITVSIAPNEHLLAESVHVIEIDSVGNEIGEVCRLYDDGNLSSHGDEIKGDNIFSAIHTFNISNEGVHRYRVSAKTSEDEGEIEGFSSAFTITVVDKEAAEVKIREIMTTLKDIEDQVKELAEQQLPTEEKERLLTEYLLSQNTIEKVERSNNELKVTHVGGFVSFIELEADSENQSVGDVNSTAPSRKNRCLPLKDQTRGSLDIDYSKVRHVRQLASSQSDKDNYILNKNILIWAPCADQFKINMVPTLRDIIDNCPVKLNPTYLENEECTLQSLENLSKYGIIVIDTHGSGGHYVLTHQRVIYENKSSFWGLFQWEEDNHEELGLLNGEYSIFTNTNGDSYYIVTSDFFRTHIKSTLPNSIVYNSSCESMKTSKLANAFIAKGARTYLGYKETTTVANCKAKAKEFFESLLGSDLKTTGESYNSMTTLFDETNDDGTVRHNALLISGSRNMRFYLGLLNGDFEYGNMSAWITSGDGRVITSLGSLRPTQGTFMGIVSTGLGYTENFGSISQSFYISTETTLSLRWNFLSEEFMEYVGSIYQDYLKVSIIDDEGEHILMRTNIDKFASNYSLSRVSPSIVFDKGDVYMTGWKTSTYDISSYRGKTVRLVIESGDVGDSYYDSATILDDITVY